MISKIMSIGNDIPQYDFDKITSASFCKNCAADAYELAKESHDLVFQAQQGFTYAKILFTLEMGAICALSAFAYSPLSLDLTVGIAPLAGAVTLVAGALFVTLGLLVYCTYNQRKFLDRAHQFEGIALQAKARAAELPAWKDPSVGLLRSLAARFYSTGNRASSLEEQSPWLSRSIDKKIWALFPFAVAGTTIFGVALALSAAWDSLPTEIKQGIRARFVSGTLAVLKGGN